MKKLLQLLLQGASIGALILSFVFLYFNMIGLEPAYYKAFFVDMVPSGAVPQVLVVSLLIAWILSVKFEKNKELAKALAPACLLYGLFCFPLTFTSILIFIFIASVCLWRCAAVCGWSFPAVRSPWLVPVAACICAAGGCAWGIYMQFEAYSRLWFTYTDWLEYYTGFLALAHHRDLAHFIYNSGHFNPLPNLLITPILALWPHPGTLYILNSFFLYLTIPLWFYVARLHGMRRFPAGLLAIMLMFHFTLPNLNLSLFYGFHPIAMFPALLMLFYIFYKKQSRIGTYVLFLMILFLQETTAVFWFGWGIYLFLKKKYWQGIALALFSCAWFALAVKFIMPFARRALNHNNVEHYVQTFHYNNVGSSVSDILLSPFTNPAVFFGQYASPLNIYFILTLLLAFFPLALSSWRILAVTLPLLAGLFLMGGSDALNISMWYQTEVFSILVLALAPGYELLRKKSIPGVMAYLPVKSPRRIAIAAIYAVAAGMFLCGLFFGRLPYGKYSFSRIQERPDAMAAIEKIKSHLEPNKLILVTPQLRMHFLANPTSDVSRLTPPFNAPYILLHLEDLHVNFEKNRELFEAMQTNPDYELIFEHKEDNLNIALYRLKKK